MVGGDEGDVGDVQVPHLVDPVADLEEPAVGIKPGLTPEAGVDRFRLFRLAGGKGELVRVEDEISVLFQNLAVGHRGDESASCFLERGLVLEVETAHTVDMGFLREVCCALAVDAH